MASHRVQEMSDLTEILVRRAQAVAQQSDELIAALEEAGRRIVDTAGIGAPRPAGIKAPPDPAPTQTEIGPVGDHPDRAPRPAAPSDSEPAPGSSRAPASARVDPEPIQAAPAVQSRRPTEPVPAPVSEGARLLATQMAIAGSSRDEIARRLHEEFGVIDPTPILEEIGAR